MVFYGFRSTKPKQIRDQKSCQRRHAPLMTPVFAASANTRTRATYKSHALTRVGAQSTCYASYARAMMSWMTSLWRLHPLRSDPFIQADPVWPIHPDPVRTACQKKIKWKKKKLWPSRTLTLTKKSKFSKRACSTQFFEYIPILRSVSSFEARKLCKLSNS